MLPTEPGLRLEQHSSVNTGRREETGVRLSGCLFGVVVQLRWLSFCCRSGLSALSDFFLVGELERMGWRKSICKVTRDAARRQAIQPATAPTCSSAVGLPTSTESLRACGGVPLDALDRSRRSRPKMQSVRSYIEADSHGVFSSEVVARWSQSRNFSGTMVSKPRSSMGIAGIHVGRTAEAVQPTYGVGPVGGADRDSRMKGSTPDDFRADDIHMAEPKEITKEKAAVAMKEPEDFQVKKMMPGWDEPVQDEADSQREPGDQVFEGETRKLEGTAQWEGDTTGTESEGHVEGQYGAAPSKEKTTRA